MNDLLLILDRLFTVLSRRYLYIGQAYVVVVELCQISLLKYFVKLVLNLFRKRRRKSVAKRKRKRSGVRRKLKSMNAVFTVAASDERNADTCLKKSHPTSGRGTGCTLK